MIRDEDTIQALVATVERFVAERLRPLEAEVAETDAIPPDVVQDMREMGLFGLTIPEEFGGLGLTMEEEVRVLLALGRTSPAFRSIPPSPSRRRSCFAATACSMPATAAPRRGASTGS